jgi:cytochrome c oxidase subunit IV
MEQMDRWGLILTFVTVAYGLALLAVYLYNIWEQGKNIIY